MGNEKSETYEIVELDHSVEKAKMRYYNSKGENGNMIGSLIENQYKIVGTNLKFSGTINDQNTKISGKWFRQAANEEWVEFIELNLEK